MRKTAHESGGLLRLAGVLREGRNGARFAPVIQTTEELVVPTISMYEVFKRVGSQRGEEEALMAVGFMSLGQVIELTQDITLHAATLSMDLHLPMADSIILATA